MPEPSSSGQRHKYSPCDWHRSKSGGALAVNLLLPLRPASAHGRENWPGKQRSATTFPTASIFRHRYIKPMKSCLLTASSTLLVCASAAAQTDISSQLLTLSGPVQDGGVYDLAAQTWSQGLSFAAGASDVLYNNTCAAFGFLSLDSGEVVIDSGRLPSTTSPTNTFSQPGSADQYDLGLIDLAYCTSETSLDIRLNLFECYAPCSDASALVPDYSFDILGAPGSLSGTPEAFSIRVDLGNLGSLPNILADSDGVYDGNTALDQFGWSFEITSTLSGGPSGPLVAGDPFGLLGGGGGMGCGWGAGTGIGTDDVLEIDTAGAMLGCNFFGGYFSGGEYASLYLKLAGADTAPPSTGTKFCFGNGLSTACPCGNNNDSSQAAGASGCANGSFHGGAELDVSGSASLVSDDATLNAAGLVPGQPGLFFQGNNAVNAGTGNSFGDGLRCAGGSVVRLGVRVANPAGEASTMGISLGATGQASAGDTRRYQLWYRDPNGSPCGNLFNLTNGLEVVWQP
jgi:hypothetical protein